MNKAVLALFLTASLSICTFSGCGSETQSQTQAMAGDVETTEQAPNSIEARYNIIEVPSDGWSMNDLFSVTYIYGKPLSYPVTMRSLSGAIKKSKEVQNDADGNTVVQLYHGNKWIGSATYKETNIDNINDDTPICALHIAYEGDDAEESVVINGAVINCSTSELSEHLGNTIDDNDGNENTISYMTKDSFTLSTVHCEKKFTALSLKNLD